ESLGSVSGVRWVNDSKATNVAAAASSLESLASPVVLLLGGADKGEDFRALAPAMRGRVRAVVAYGAAGERVAAEVEAATGGRIEVRRVVGTFAEAVSEGARVAVPGE
ncbi:MAG: UDP-N-acetylmuramoyl-L-alanine--D-glutamate ligase, partial [Gemmatimonadetes bacterium]|nr:UDP-N-acetylmuramoyl-L-alanine--D-glutamate ligase [Gemmatimonadota bacterium]